MTLAVFKRKNFFILSNIAAVNEDAHTIQFFSWWLCILILTKVELLVRMLVGISHMAAILVNLLLLLNSVVQAANVDVIDYREPAINNLFEQGTSGYTFFKDPCVDLSKTNGLSSAKARENQIKPNLSIYQF